MSNHSLHSHYRATIQQYYYFQSEGMADTDEIGREFDQFIAQVEAAAEQLGAIKALRDAADIKLGNEYYEMLVEDELNTRADLIADKEGNDE